MTLGGKDQLDDIDAYVTKGQYAQYPNSFNNSIRI